MSAVIQLEEMAELMRCSEVKVKEMLASGELPGIMPGKSWVVPREAFYEALNGLARDEAKRRKLAASPQPQPQKSRRGPVPRAAGMLAAAAASAGY